jgi:hypothetical protein
MRVNDWKAERQHHSACDHQPDRCLDKTPHGRHEEHRDGYEWQEPQMKRSARQKSPRICQKGKPVGIVRNPQIDDTVKRRPKEPWRQQPLRARPEQKGPLVRRNDCAIRKAVKIRNKLSAVCPNRSFGDNTACAITTPKAATKRASSIESLNPAGGVLRPQSVVMAPCANQVFGPFNKFSVCTQETKCSFWCRNSLSAS